jgi:CheY-like chemotaxis protein
VSVDAHEAAAREARQMLLLPSMDGDTISTLSTAPSEPAHGRKPVLVVDDDADIREAVTQVLENDGYPVAGASNGREALEVLHRMPRPGAIVLDLMMPVMDGWQFRAEQRRDPELASIPVIVVSALGRGTQRVAALDAVAYVQKPLMLDPLLDAVSKYCDSDGREPE